MSFSGSNFRRGNAQRYRQSLTGGHPKSTPKASAKNFASDRHPLFRKLCSHLIREISWTDTKATTSSSTRSSLLGLERRVPNEQLSSVTPKGIIRYSTAERTLFASCGP